MKTNCSHKDNLIMRKRFVGSNHKTKIAEAILKEKAHSVALLSDVWCYVSENSLKRQNLACIVESDCCQASDHLECRTAKEGE